MFLDYSKLEFDSFGRPEVPELALQTLSGETICTLSLVSNLRLNIKFSEPSEITFDIPKQSDGIPTPHYEDITGYKLIYTKRYGIYIIMSPSVRADGISEVKTVKGYSIEKTLDSKRFFLEEGTFNFWNPAAPADTLLGRVLELAPGWSVGYVSPALIGRYRTFDSYDDYLLSFLYNTAPEKFRCVFVFEPYGRTINAYDADEERPALPIYMDFGNLVQSLDVEEMSDELVTALRPYGADELDIRAVNPIGTNWIYDLSYFIAKGDIPQTLARKWEAWQRSILNNREHYRGLTCLMASTTARLLAEKAKLTDLRGELDDLTNQQSVTIQALALEKTSAGKDAQQRKLDEINRKLAAKRTEVSAKESEIKAIQEELESDAPTSYHGQIKAINDALAIDRYFTTEEYRVLASYFIEQDITEETFVATDIDEAVSGQSYPVPSGTVSLSGASITEIDLSQAFGKHMYAVTGGSLSIGGGLTLNGNVIRGTLEVGGDGSFVMSVYAGALTASGKTVESGTLTMSGTLSGLNGDMHTADDDGVVSMVGSRLACSVSGASLYLTANVSEYQRYSVQLELFDHAARVLADAATPTYEFSMDSANFLFAREFAPFREKLELGKGIYLNMGDGVKLTPLIIEFELDFENREKFSLIFSNRFKRHDNVNTLKDMIESSYSSGRNFDANKYLYNQTAGKASEVSRFMNSSLDAARNAIVGAANQSVLINGSGIQVGGDSKYKLRIVDSMIAMTDDDWGTAKMAIGRFASPEIGEYWGVNAEVIGGKLIVGNNLVVENTSDEGVTQFKVDATGAWLNNSTMVLQKDSGGKILIDPKYGIVAGDGNLYTTEGTTVKPFFIDEDGKIVLDRDGLPKNANFFLDLRDGSAYFRGKVHATDGVFNGTVYARDGEFTGTVHARDGEFTGTIHARDGDFSGTIRASVLDGKLVGGTNGGLIEGVGLNIGNGAFTVDRSGNVVIQKGSISWGAVTGTGEIDRRIQNAQDAATDAYNGLERLVSGRYSSPKSTFIDGTTVQSPTIEAGVLNSAVINGGEINGVNIYGGSFYDLSGKTRLVLNPSGSSSGVADLNLYSGLNIALRLYDQVTGGLDWCSYDTLFMKTGQRGVFALGDWNFTGANVTGLTATFA